MSRDADLISGGEGQGPGELQRAIGRYVDGEMPPAEAEEFASRVAADPKVAEMLRQAQELRDLFAAGRDQPVLRPDSEFKARVIREVTRLPSYADWQHDWQERSQLVARRQIAIWGQAIAAAALVLLALGVMVYHGLLGPADSGRLEASPADISREMLRLDEAISRRAERSDAAGRDR